MFLTESNERDCSDCAMELENRRRWRKLKVGFNLARCVFLSNWRSLEVDERSGLNPRITLRPPQSTAQPTGNPAKHCAHYAPKQPNISSA